MLSLLSLKESEFLFDELILTRIIEQLAVSITFFNIAAVNENKKKTGLQLELSYHM